MVIVSCLVAFGGSDDENASVSAAQLAAMIGRIADNTISNSAAKQVFDALWTEGGEVDAIIEAKGLKQMNDTGALEAIIDEVLAANPKTNFYYGGSYGSLVCLPK